MNNAGSPGLYCPDEGCGSSQIYKRTTMDPPWRCQTCGAEFQGPGEHISVISSEGGRSNRRTCREVHAESVKEVLKGMDKNYVKSKNVAQHLEISSRQVGQAMMILEEEGVVEKWGATMSTSWKVNI